MNLNSNIEIHKSISGAAKSALSTYLNSNIEIHKCQKHIQKKP